MFYLRSASSRIVNSLATGFEVATYLWATFAYTSTERQPLRGSGLITLFPSIGYAPERQKSQLFSRPDPPISNGYSQIASRSEPLVASIVSTLS